MSTDSSTELYQIDISHIEKLLESEPGLALRFYCRISRNLAEILLSMNPAMNRKAQVLSKTGKTGAVSQNFLGIF